MFLFCRYPNTYELVVHILECSTIIYASHYAAIAINCHIAFKGSCSVKEWKWNTTFDFKLMICNVKTTFKTSFPVTFKVFGSKQLSKRSTFTTPV